MNEAVLIREYTESDRSQVIELLRLNTPRYFAPSEEKDLLHYLDNEIDHYFVAEVENRVVACGGINFSEDGTAGKISWDIVHPAYKGKKIGTKLLEHRIKKLEELGRIKTITVRTSQHAYMFYEKCGFKLAEVVEDHWAEGFDMYGMEYVK